MVARLCDLSAGEQSLARAGWYLKDSQNLKCLPVP